MRSLLVYCTLNSVYEIIITYAYDICMYELNTDPQGWISFLGVVPSCSKTAPNLPHPFLFHVTDFLKLTLENYVKTLEVPVKIIRMEERSGLIRARLRGAAASKGQVITFLDAHCECTLGWLEPLLARIKEDR